MPILCDNCDPEFLVCGDCAYYSTIDEYCIMNETNVDAMNYCESFHCIVVMKETIKRHLGY